MPYGMSKKIGGDTKATEAKMDACVQDLMKEQGYSKIKAVVLCKASITRSMLKKR